MVRSLGNYDLGELIGRGGMSEVYEARHRALGGRVAIKVLRSPDADAFAAEAARTRAIVHPNVVQVRDFGHDDGTFYLVMERLDGDTLATVLARGPLPEARAREIGAAIADGIAAAHEVGIVHRDLKPGNVVLVDGEPKLVDFGIARYFTGEQAHATTTRIGTPGYMAPEQLAGGLVAPAIDVWALGVVLFEMVTGRLPFDTSNGASPQLVTTAPRPTASASYAALVARCLAREPGRRPSIDEVARALREPATAERLTEDLGPAPRKRRWIAPVAALALCIGGVVAWRALAESSSQTSVDALPPPAAEPLPVPSATTTSVDPPPPPPAPPAKRKPAHAVHRGSAAPTPRAGETLD